MFTYVKLKNFKCYKEITFNLCQKKDTPNHLVLLYGENGAGKTNLLSAFSFLNDITDTMNVKKYQDSFIESISRESDKLDPKLAQDFINKFKTINSIVNEYRMIGLKENLVAEYGFICNGNNGIYSIELDDNGIVKEQLEYTINERKGTIFKNSNNHITINKSISNNSQFINEIKTDALKFNGKHSILSIIKNKIYDLSEEYTSISTNFKRILRTICDIPCKITGYKNYLDLGTRYSLIDNNLLIGTASSDQVEQIKGVGNILNSFFCATNSNIKKVFYKFSSNLNKGDSDITYELFETKILWGKSVTTPFQIESTGNLKLLRVFAFILLACNGNTVVIDEIDQGIHDVLLKRIMTDLVKCINGQLIISTHNTMLMEESTPRASIYTIKENSLGVKEVLAITKNKARIYIDTNIRQKYLNGAYSGLPKYTGIDFNNLSEQLHNISSI